MTALATGLRQARALARAAAYLPETTYYEATTRRVAAPALSGDITADAVVIGGGYLGLTTALRLAERGRDVVLLEAGRVGGGASGRNGGFVLPGFTAGNEAIAHRLGDQAAADLWALSVEGVAEVKALIARHQIDCDLRGGVFVAAAEAGHARSLRREAATLRRHFGYRSLEHFDAAEGRDIVATERYFGGNLDRNAAQLHPLRYAVGLADAARAAGVRIFENSPVIAVDQAGAMPVARTTLGSVRAGSVVLAANAYIGGLAPDVAGRILPFRTFMVATEPLPRALAARLFPAGAAVYDTQAVLDYYRLGADGRLLFGGGCAAGDWSRERIARAMRRKIGKVFPELGGVRIDYAWGGLIDVTVNRMTDVGRTADGIWYAQGFSGHGVALTARTGRALADAICGDGADYARLAAMPHRSVAPLRPIAGLALQAGLVWQRVRQGLGSNALMSL